MRRRSAASFTFGLAFILAVVLLLAGLSASPAHSAGTPRVIGGHDAADGAYPWLASLLFSNDESEFCGGTLIAPQWVLSAAHCIHDTEVGPRDMLVQVRGDSSPIIVDRVVVYPQYDDRRTVNDVALVHLQQPSAAPAVPLAPYGRKLRRERGLILGWGYTDAASNELPYRLQEAAVTLLRDRACRSSYTDPDDGQMCVRVGGDHADTCPGDSGGPLLVADPTTSVGWLQVGITSFGADACGTPGIPGVYTRVSAYHSWVNLIMNGAREWEVQQASVQLHRGQLTPQGRTQLRYRVLPAAQTHDRLRADITVFARNRVLTHWTQLWSGRHRWQTQTWRANRRWRRTGSLRWCVTAVDANGNRSVTRCAAVAPPAPRT